MGGNEEAFISNDPGRTWDLCAVRLKQSSNFIFFTDTHYNICITKHTAWHDEGTTDVGNQDKQDKVYPFDLLLLFLSQTNYFGRV